MDIRILREQAESK
uniref:Uncharacterized protein n=1 Tax=Arundo donax TaxID=35708 RepID=A0A0A9B4F9_ARUDO